MKIYQVFDDSDPVLTTTNRLKMLEKLYVLFKRYSDKQTWYNVWESKT